MRRSLQSGLAKGGKALDNQRTCRAQWSCSTGNSFGMLWLAGWVFVGAISGRACRWHVGRAVQKLYAVFCTSMDCLASAGLCGSAQRANSKLASSPV